VLHIVRQRAMIPLSWALLTPVQAASCRLAVALAGHPVAGEHSAVHEELCDDLLARVCQENRLASVPLEWDTATAAAADVRYESSTCKTVHRVINSGQLGQEHNANGHDCVMVISSPIFGGHGRATTTCCPQRLEICLLLGAVCFGLATLNS
jgi:hypothetical protein